MNMKVRNRTNRRVVAAVFNAVWAIHPQKMEEIREFMTMRAAGIRLTKTEVREKLGTTRSSKPQPAANRVAVLQLFGVVSQRMNAMEQISGGTSTEMFGKAFDAAIADDSIKAIVIHIDSPGGVVTGTPELASKIFNARGTKPIIAVTDAMMASAAYWIGSAADEIVATPSAEIGSIGVLSVHTDQSKLDAETGLKYTFITSVPYKAEGNAHEPLGEEAREYLQKRVENTHVQFVTAVARHRGLSADKVNADFGQGRMKSSADAKKAGMIDRIGTLEEVLASFGVSSGAAGVSAATPRPAFDLKGNSMDPKILTAMVRKGLCSVDTPEAEARAALRAYFVARGVAPPADDTPADLVLNTLNATEPIQHIAATAAPLIPETIAKPNDQQAKPEGVAADDIIAAIKLAPLSADKRMDLTSELVAKASTLTMKQVLDRINSEAAASNPPAGATVVRPVAAERDKFMVAARDALLTRTWGHSLPDQIWDQRAGDFVDWKPTAGSSRAYSLNSLIRLAEQCLIQSGVPAHQVAQLAPSQVATAIMGKPLEQLGIFASSDGPAYNVSGMFANILYDASNVMLRRSYAEANTTFQAWTRQGESLPNFKQVHKIIAGELPDPKAIPEDGEFEESTLADGRESYRLTVWGEVFSITWQTIVDDQLSAFVEIPQKQGRAMRRKQNKLVYAVLLDNAALSDGVALFNTSALSAGGHNNLTTGAATPTVDTLNTMYTKMAQQVGLNVAAQTTLGLEPKYLITCPALRGTVLQLLGSTANPASGGNSGVKNIWQNALEPVIDAQLGAAAGGSDTAWYLAADSADVDTIEYAYLQGLETPAMDQQPAFDRLAMRFRIYQAFATKALDFRGLQKHAGA